MSLQTLNPHQQYIKRCIQLAYNGLGTTYPNPMVGSVIVCNGKIIGEGWHQKAGEAHAEVRAIASVMNKELLTQSTLYVSLEPCSHFGKTPPCADLIIQHRIPRVVIGATDPFAQVQGRGIEKLREAGCEVIVGVCQKECEELNKRFFTFHNKKRPYIFLKWAETRDGFIAPMQKESTAPYWISNTYSRQLAHQWRSQEGAILVGVGTVLADNPSLDTRSWYGANPMRVVIDPHWRTPKDFKVYDSLSTTLFFTQAPPPTDSNHTHFFATDFSQKPLQQICTELHKRNIQSLIVEGGANTLQQFINEELWDEALIFTGNTTFGNGIKAPTLPHWRIVSQTALVGDTLTVAKPE